jgi:GrpB-like predicted nucleotidyltransferase (UPF0157 family)
MITLSPYNLEWPLEFAAEKAILQNLLGTKLIAIEHIGSTAIPFIHAKPVIDIMIGVTSVKEITPEIISSLQNHGYKYIQEFEVCMPYRRYFQKNNSAAVRTHQIHLVEMNSDFWQRHLRFRDYLRAHREDAIRYEKLKQELAKRFTDTSEYATAKSDFCNEINSKALVFEK